MQTSHKLILALSVTLVAGYTWSLDMPLALQVPLRQQPYNFSSFDFSFLYFATYIAICFCDVLIGMLLDKWSLKRTVLWITSICLVAEIGILAMFHFRFQGYKIALYVLRGFFGVTGSGLFTVQAMLITKYGGKYYDTLIGVGVCIPFLFDSLNNIITPLIYDKTNSMDLVWLIGVGFCLVGLLSSVAISKMIDGQQKQKEQFSPQKNQVSMQKGQELSFRGLKTMSKQFWVIIGAVFFFELCIATYIDNLNDTLVKRFKFSYVTAGYFLFIPYGVAALLSFLIGRILEKKPHIKRKIILTGGILFCLGMIGSYLLPNIETNAKIPTFYYVFVGIQFVTISLMMSILYGCLSSSIKYVVDEENLGIAWGVIGSSVGLSEACGPLIAAAVIESTENLALGYQRLALCVFLISLVAVQFALWIYYGAFEKIQVNSLQYLPDLTLNDSLIPEAKVNRKTQSKETLDSVSH